MREQHEICHLTWTFALRVDCRKAHVARLRAPLVFCAALVICGCRSIPAEKGWYMGAGIGYTSTATQSCNNPGEGSLVIVNSCSVSGTSTGEKIFGGYQFNRYLAVEGGIADLGTLTENWNGSDCCAAGGLRTPIDHSSTSRTVGPFVHTVGTLPITKEFSWLGWIGPGPIGYGPVLLGIGVGAKYDFNERVGVRVEYGQYYGSGNLIDWRIDLTSVSVVYYFRQK